MPAQPINNVNFVRKRRWQAEQSRRRDRWVLWGAVGVFVVGAALTAGALAFEITLQSANRQLTENIATQQALANRLAGSEAQFIIYTNRLDTMKALLENRHSNAVAFAFIQRLIAPQLSFDQIRIDPQTRELRFLVRASSVLAVQSFLDTVNSPAIAQDLSKLDLSSIKRDEAGQYTLQATVVLKSEGVKP
jgi:Tfp pilus assembly protein PilN